MLPDPLRQSYQNFFSALDQLDVALETGEPQRLQLSFPNLQDAFASLEQQLNDANADSDLDEAITSRIQSIHTEINKQMRLLNTDIAFLGTAKQPDTVQQRQGQIGDRLQRLRQYGDAVFALGERSSSETDADS